jgi:hypothetical protein
MVQVWPVLANNYLENCTVASAMHAVQLWKAANGENVWPDEDCAVANFTHLVGYDPVTGANNRGAYLTDVMKFWMKTGFAITPNGQPDILDGCASIDPLDTDAIMQGVSSFGVLYAGAELPATAMTEFTNRVPWKDLTGAPVYGHAIPIVDVTEDGPITVTWGGTQVMTWDWWKKYGSECYAVLRTDWIGRNGLAPSGLTMDQLDTRVTNMRGNLGLGAH